MTELSPVRLTEELRSRGYLQHGNVVRIERGERFNSSGDTVYRLHLHYSAETVETAPQALICKQLITQPDDLLIPHELYFHETIASQMPEVPVVKSYGLIHDIGKTYLLLEDLSADYALATPPISERQLEAVTDLLIDLHAHWWQHPLLASPQLLAPDPSVCRMPQALFEAAIRKNAAEAKVAALRFLHNHDDALSRPEKNLLELLAQKWGDLMCQRISSNRSITLIHGDFHLLGNIFFARDQSTQPAIKIIDWAQSKRGIGAHDLMYTLLSADSDERVARDKRFLGRYHKGLIDAGITDYSWQQCLWDFQFSLLTNLFQSVFQGSLRWFRKTFEVIEIWQSATLLNNPR